MSYKYKLASVWALFMSCVGFVLMWLGLYPHTLADLISGVSMLAVGVIIGYGDRDE